MVINAYICTEHPGIGLMKFHSTNQQCSVVTLYHLHSNARDTIARIPGDPYLFCRHTSARIMDSEGGGIMCH